MQDWQLSSDWKLIKIPKKYRQKHPPKKKLRILVDENIPSSFVELLKSHLPFSIMTVSDLGMNGKLDESIRYYAKNKQLSLLTTDKDFLNEKKHPIRECFGIFCLECGPQDLVKMVENYATFYSYLQKGSSNEFWDMKKILIKTNSFIVYASNQKIISFEFRIYGSKVYMRKLS